MNFHPELLYHNPNVLNSDRIKKQIHKLTFFNKSIPKHINDVITKLREQTQEVYMALKPLENIGIFFNIALVGGSIRDLLSGKYNLISDLDILLNFSSFFPFSNQRTVNLIELRSILDINEHDVPSIAWLDGDFTKPAFSHWENIFLPPFASKEFNDTNSKDIEKSKIQICYDLAFCLLRKKFNISAHYPPYKNSPLSNSYTNERLKGVIKLDTNYPIDILISHTKNPRYFIESFDFDICKIGVDLVDLYMSKKSIQSFPKNNKEFLLKVFFDKNFLIALKEKKIYLNITHFPYEDVQRSIEIHLPKILKKYDYELVFIAPIIESFNNDYNVELLRKVKYIKTYLMKRNLNESLENKEKLKVVKI